QLPLVDGKLAATGKVGDAVSIEDAASYARICVLTHWPRLRPKSVIWITLPRLLRLWGLFRLQQISISNTWCLMVHQNFLAKFSKTAASMLDRLWVWLCCR